MTIQKNFKLSMAAIAASLLVAACGGGGGDSTSGSASPPSGASQPATSSNPVIAPQTSVPAPTYAAGTGQYGMFTTINAYRSQMGVGMVAQDLLLDAAAQSHAQYEQINLTSGAETSLSHTENSANPGFYEAWPYLRARKAGTAANLWVGEVVAAGWSADNSRENDGTRCVQQWINTVYHLASLVGNQTSVGLGYVAPASASSLSFCVADFGAVSSPAPTTENDYNTTPYNAGQQIAAGQVVHAPYTNETNVALAMHTEIPNPAPDLSAPGRPIMVSVNAQNRNVLTVDSFELKDASGNVVPARILVPASAVSGSKAAVTADVNKNLFAGTAFLLPLAPLTANTVYTATFSGARDGTPVSTSWQFTTAAN
ncbi:Uncharacterized conserved protein YkwD, contains CAP (CSP/antigen 5/PR1) domain [Caballeronia arationis]|jgi:uncharacterized protein YkwD|uniref:Uncharacterized conserved protein YkwD, contains CAP (CSP/antigen 5/PR1) domain n=1 Tax=Caballeronia arationis TaxID=1777142 RepID=A0A7Z7IFE6_9BURK|nr:CAP domain-containing protein [Caballeronia arationis]SOE91593.1 Uncharacterized conserved protein YkwD, contains CAP (CSP/antigen 5/PR1) domain [Caballeronia arationis]